MKNIRLVVFNEPYWDKGLIYSQNILPLLQLVKTRNYSLDIFSFTSLPMLFKHQRQIQKTKNDLKQYNVSIRDFPILFYPTRFMLLRYLLIPFYFFNVFFYIKYLSYIDKAESNNIIYSIRSYQAALGFLKFYKRKDRIVFDTRTDWIEENINVGNFNPKGLTVRFWKRVEKDMLISFNKTLFISDLFRARVLERNGISLNEEKYCLVYNTIDYSHFQSINNDKTKDNFLYTGSLGHWNNISIYLDLFLSLSEKMIDSKFIICTNSPSHKLMPILSMPKYDKIRSRVEVYFNIEYSKLPVYYNRCSYGLQLMNKKDSRVGVKFIEYVAAGLLPIVNLNVMGAAALVKKYGIGIILDEYDNIDGLVNSIRKAKNNINLNNFNKLRELTDLSMISKILEPIYS